MSIKKIMNAINDNQKYFKAALAEYYKEENLTKPTDKLTSIINQYSQQILSLSQALDKTDITTVRAIDTVELNKTFLSKGTIILKNKLAKNDNFVKACCAMEKNLIELNKKIHSMSFIDENEFIKRMNDEEKDLYSKIVEMKSFFIKNMDDHDPSRINRNLQYCIYVYEKIDNLKTNKPDISNELRIELYNYIDKIDSALRKLEEDNKFNYIDLRTEIDELIDVIDINEKIKILELDDLDEQLNIDYTKDKDDQLKLLKKFIENFNSQKKDGKKGNKEVPQRKSLKIKSLNSIKSFFVKKSDKSNEPKLSDLSQSSESSRTSSDSENNPDKKSPKI